jgi:hypothetical protein
MAKVGYCSGCGRYVELLEDRSCANGHPVSMIRDVRDSVPAVTATPASAKSPASSGMRAGAPQDAAKRADAAVDAMVKVSWVLTIVIAVGVFVAGTWLSVPEYTGMGMSTPMAWLASAGSAGLTVGGTVAWAQYRRKRKKG